SAEQKPLARSAFSLSLFRVTRKRNTPFRSQKDHATPAKSPRACKKVEKDLLKMQATLRQLPELKNCILIEMKQASV
uniref:BHLH domain-containing protein n=1 Tax=Steinernema glaseri TaxID=37863 RepID=A0A1I7Y2G6_9BILA